MIFCIQFVPAKSNEQEKTHKPLKGSTDYATKVTYRMLVQSIYCGLPPLK